MEDAIPDKAHGSIEILNVRLPLADKGDAKTTWTIQCIAGKVNHIIPFGKSDRISGTDLPLPFIDGDGGILIPSFCHSHIHLDKCFILEHCGDLVTGDFTEAMRITNIAKGRFPQQMHDLYARGARIIRESVENGVTCMRAHVEIDTSVGFACLEVEEQLQADYRSICDVQISLFAQEPLLSSDDEVPTKNLSLLKEAAGRNGVDVIGSAPYVEESIQESKANIGIIMDIADERGISHVDFHLDYNLDPTSEPLTYEVVDQVRKRYVTQRQVHSSTGRNNGTMTSNLDDENVKRRCPNITIGHATRLQLFSHDEWLTLADAISGLPITFVGLPQSDIYMQGRASKDDPLGAPRGTLKIPDLARKYGIQVAMSVNNVENAFTPQGSLDPLSLCAFGVGIFQTATPQDVRSLVRSVTRTSKGAIGHTEEGGRDLTPCIGEQADFVILHGRDSLLSAVLNPPVERTTIKAGRVVASRRVTSWLATDIDRSRS